VALLRNQARMEEFKAEKQKHEEIAAQAGALSIDDVYERFRGKNVALIGNAESLFAHSYGTAINAHEIVVRINKGFIVNREAQGSRTDVLASSYPLSEEDIRSRFNAPMMLWMTPKLDMMPRYGSAIRAMTFVQPYGWWHELYSQLENTRPSTGAMLIHMLAKHIPVRHLSLFGFDFFQTKTFYEQKLRSNVPHNFFKEREYVLQLIRQGYPLEVFGEAFQDDHFSPGISSLHQGQFPM
jgi:hypothetical protein